MKILITFVMLFIGICLYAQPAWDINTLRSINTPHSLKADGFMNGISNSTFLVVGGLPTAMMTVALIRGHSKDNNKLLSNSFLLIWSTAAVLGTTDVLKNAFDRKRPFITHSDIFDKTRNSGNIFTDPSMPSGHTSAAFNTATYISLAYPKWYVIVPAFTWAGAVGYSRMYLGVHYPSDVLVGAVYGVGTAYLTYWLNKKLCDCHKFRRREPLGWMN
jgi:membrane-associated phospholipid phosphatase